MYSYKKEEKPGKWQKTFLSNLHNLIKDETVYQSFNKYFMVSPFSNQILNSAQIKFIGGCRRIYYNNVLVPHITEYESFYPEFYQYWELFQKTKILDNSTKIGFFRRSSSKGSIEGTIKWRETNSHYEYDEYIDVVVEEDKDTPLKFNNVYRYEKHNFKGELDIIKYYNSNLFDTVLLDKPIDKDIMLAMTTIRDSGSIVIRLSLLRDDIVNIITFMNNRFGKVELLKAECQHPLDPILYLVGTEFTELSNPEILEIAEWVKGIKCDHPLSVITTDSVNLYNKFENRLTDSILSFMRILSLDNKDSLPENMDITSLEYIQKGISWAHKYSMEPKSIYEKRAIIDAYDYLTFEFSHNDMKDVKIDNKVYPSLYNETLHENKRRLNHAKRKIDTNEQFIDNDVDNGVIDWNKLTDCIDLHRNLKRTISWLYKGEMVTNAWMKIYEVLDNERIAINHKGGFKTFHLCEAPGAFILSTNHYLKSNTEVSSYDWYAQTLNPSSSKNKDKKRSVLKDDFGIISAYPNRWLYGRYNTGDITDPGTIYSYKENPCLSDLDLITGDGGLKTPMHMFNEQERYVSKVIYGQVLTMLYLLPKGKDCIFKTFIPFTESITISLMYLLTILFKKVNVHKPLTSHPSSSEVYVVCRDYCGLEIDLRTKLFKVLTDFTPDISIFKKIPSQFIKELERCSSLFVNRQIDSINRSLYYRYLYYDDYDMQKEVTNQREKSIEKWISKYKLKKIPQDQKIIVNKVRKKYRFVTNRRKRYRRNR